MELPHLNDLPPETVDKAREFAQQFLQERYPDMELDRGMLGELVTGMHAVMHAANLEMIERFRRSLSLALVEEDPSRTYREVTDGWLNSFGIQRDPAGFASGRVLVVFDRPDRQIFSKDNRWISGGNHFEVDVHTEVEPVPVDNNRWIYDINVHAMHPGPGSKLRANTKLAPLHPPTGFVEAWAIEDFEGGESAASTADLAQQLKTRAAPPGFANRQTITSLIRGINHDCSTVEDVSVVGANDKEMTRDGGHGGKIDIYVRSAKYPVVRHLLKTAKEIGPDNLYAINIDASDAPGYYRIQNLRQLSQGLQEPHIPIRKDIRLIDEHAGGRNGTTVRDTRDSVYTCYQRGQIKFKDPNPPEDLQYTCQALMMPWLDQIQRHIDHPDIRPPAADVLIRAPIPCFVTVYISLYKTHDVVTDHLEIALKSEVANLVNSQGISGKLFVNDIVAKLGPMLPPNVKLEDVSVDGVVKHLDGDDDTLVDVSDILTATRNDKTIAMFCEPESVRIDYYR